MAMGVCDTVARYVLSLVCAALAAGLFAPQCSQAATIDVSQLQLTWSDEFNGTALDTSRWYAPTELRQGHSRWTPQQVSVSGGVLRLGIHLVDDPVVKYECGAVQTQVGYDPNQILFQQKFGYFEIRCKLPANIGADYWAAFWLMAGNVWSPDSRDGTEIDIMESFNYYWPGQHQMTFHWNGYGPNHNSASIACGPQPQVLDGNFHTFGFWWDEQYYIGYVDGVEVGRTDMIGLGSSAPGKTLSQGTCLAPGIMLLSNEAALWPGASSGWESYLPPEDAFLVDYVRVYSVPEPGAALTAIMACALALRRLPLR